MVLILDNDDDKYNLDNTITLSELQEKCSRSELRVPAWNEEIIDQSVAIINY